MSLFNKEVENPAYREQPARPNISTAQSATPVTPPAQKDRRVARSRRGFLGYGTKISGKLHFEGSVRIDGDLDGEIESKEITIGESAVVTAQIRADSIVLCGKVKGEINATQRIEIRATAKITGDITTPKLIIQEGAIFEGRCSTRERFGRRSQSPPPRRPCSRDRTRLAIPRGAVVRPLRGRRHLPPATSSGHLSFGCGCGIRLLAVSGGAIRRE